MTEQEENAVFTEHIKQVFLSGLRLVYAKRLALITNHENREKLLLKDITPHSWYSLKLNGENLDHSTKQASKMKAILEFVCNTPANELSHKIIKRELQHLEHAQ